MKTNTKIALAVAAGAAALLLKKKHSVDGIGTANYFPDIKRRQLDIILSSNPADENLSYHTWIRDVDDILLYEEACADESCLSFAPDYTEKDAMKALRNKKLRVYSSYPIENGVFVTPSYMEAKSYAGSGNVYDKVVLLDDVAWIDTLQGQYAPVSGYYDDIVKDARSLKNPFDINTVVLYRVDDNYAAFDTNAIILNAIYPSLPIEDYEDGSVVVFGYRMLDAILPLIKKAGYNIVIGDEVRVKHEWAKNNKEII